MIEKCCKASIIEATREGSKNLVKSLKEMNETSKSIQKCIMEIEMKLHKENMEYRHLKDERVQELARLALLNHSTMLLP